MKWVNGLLVIVLLKTIALIGNLLSFNNTTTNESPPCLNVGKGGCYIWAGVGTVKSPDVSWGFGSAC